MWITFACTVACALFAKPIHQILESNKSCKNYACFQVHLKLSTSQFHTDPLSSTHRFNPRTTPFQHPKSLSSTLPSIPFRNPRIRKIQKISNSEKFFYLFSLVNPKQYSNFRTIWLVNHINFPKIFQKNLKIYLTLIFFGFSRGEFREISINLEFFSCKLFPYIDSSAIKGGAAGAFYSF